MRLPALFFCLMMIAVSAFAAEQDEIPFREDSGLTKTEDLLMDRQFSAALDTAGDVLARHPNNADAYTYRGYAYARLGEAGQAEKSFKKALQLNPTHLGANKYLADIYLQAGDVSRALEQMQVIRMTCGHSDCEELNELERSIDRFKHGERPENGNKEDKKEE